MKKQLTIILILQFFVYSITYAEQIKFSANSMTGSSGENSEYTKLSGNAFIQTESMEINADEVILSGKDFRFITATGNVDGKNTESGFDFKCQQLEYDRELKIALLKGNVTMIDIENEVNATAQIIEYDQNSDIAFMQINVKLIQKKNTCTGATAIYRKDDQTLELSGSPQIIKDKDTFKANEIFMNLDTEQITLDGKVRGSVTDNGNTKTGETNNTTKATSNKTAESSNTNEEPNTTTKATKVQTNEETKKTEKDENNIK